jgi:hypothetical protein
VTNADLPKLFSEVEDTLESQVLNEAAANDEAHREPAAHSSTKATAIHHVRIRQLQSEIQDKLYSPMHHLGAEDVHCQMPPLEWFSLISQRLVSWRRKAPAPIGFCSDTWFDLNYHITLTLLNRPSPRNPKPSRESLRITRQASSAVMRSYKEMLKTGRVNWSESTVTVRTDLRLASNVSIVYRRHRISEQPLASGRARLDYSPVLC